MTTVAIAVTTPISFPEPTIIAVNGVDLEVFEAGQPNAGRPIVLCHGFPALAYAWRYQVPVLVATGFHVIAPNQRGYGNSSCPAEATIRRGGAASTRERILVAATAAWLLESVVVGELI
jgi:pimeloyl-ACP methyl ester carboxylesterase